MTVDQSFLPFFLDEAADILAEWEKSCLEMERHGGLESTEAVYRAAHNLKSGSAAVGLSDLSAFVHTVENLMSKILSGQLTQSPDILQMLLSAHAILMNWFAGLRDNPGFQTGGQATELKDRIVEVLAKLDQSSKIVPVEQTVPKEDVASVQTQELAQVVVDTPPPTPIVKTDSPAVSHTNRPAENIRVAASKLDLLIQLVGELSTQQSIVWHGRLNGQLHLKSCDNAIQLIQKTAKDLQATALSLRMQPLQSLFQRLERAARDIARSQGKKIDVIMQGEEVDLDRSVVERITEPLMHVIRNAVDHGVEKPDARKAAGKKETAVIRIHGDQEPGGVLLTIADDGKGLQPERILQKALERGIAKAEHTYTPTEIQNFIFHHGFSTAEIVTDVSGRGVGMDIVKTAVESISGQINVSSEPGHGTQFMISLPATLSIVDALLVESHGHCYAIPVQDVSEVINLAEYKMETAASSGRFLVLREQVIPVQRLTDHLPNASKQFADSEDLTSVMPALIIRMATQTIAFEVGRVIGRQAVSLRKLPAGLGKICGFTGGTILGDGDPCVILNLPALARKYFEQLPDGIQSIGSQGHLEQDNYANDQEDRYLIFSCDGQNLAVALSNVREILSPQPLEKMIGAANYFDGCLNLRGQFLKVVNLSKILNLSHRSDYQAIMVIETRDGNLGCLTEKIEGVSYLEHASITETVRVKGDSSLIERHTKGLARYHDQLITIVDLPGILCDLLEVHQVPTHVRQLEVS
jgi:two-component system chemotaxis sensor kinase CheA